MAGLNKVLIIGNFARDPVTRVASGGTAICEMGLATNRRCRTASGQEGDVVWDEPLLDQVFVSDSDEWAMPMSLPVFLRLKGRAQSGWQRLLRAV